MTNTDLATFLNWRYATKQFDSSRKLDEAQVHALTEALRLSPSSFGLQPWKFFLIENPELRQQLRAHSWNQPQVTEASHFLVLAAKNPVTADDVSTWLAQLAEIQGTQVESLAMLQNMILGFISRMDEAEMRSWSAHQVYIALGQLMTSAAVLGIDACPMEGISPADYDTVLNLTGSAYSTVVACAIGHRDASDKYATMPKARMTEGQVLVRL